MPRDITIGPVQREAFGLRLKIAARSRTLTAGKLFERIQSQGRLSENGFWKHWGGTSIAGKELRQIYATILDVSPDWLENGGGEDIEILRSAFVAMENGDHQSPDLIAIQKQIGINTDDRGSVNHPLEDFGTASGKTLEVCHIPILSGADLAGYVFGNASVNIMNAIFVPVLLKDGLGPRSVGYEIPRDDLSMTSTGGRSFPPGTVLVFDPSRPILPGDFVLVRAVGEEAWIVRRYKAALAFGKAKHFTLEALNPSFEPIRVTDASEWDVAGRAVKIVSDL